MGQHKREQPARQVPTHRFLRVQLLLRQCCGLHEAPASGLLDMDRLAFDANVVLSDWADASGPYQDVAFSIVTPVRSCACAAKTRMASETVPSRRRRRCR